MKFKQHLDEVKDIRRKDASERVKKYKKIIEKLADDLKIPFESVHNAIADLVVKHFKY